MTPVIEVVFTCLFNGVDLKNSNLQVPNFDTVKDLAEKNSSKIEHLRLLQLDIMLDENNEPLLIEYNVRAFAPWVFQFTSGTAFREYTDEIIEYCKANKDKATRVYITF